MHGGVLNLFGRSKKCYACGGDFDVKRCGCGRYHCSAHGFAGKCYVCQSTSVGKISPSIGEATTTKSPKQPVSEEGDLVRRTIRASFDHDPLDVASLRDNLILELKRYKPVVFPILGVKANREIRWYYHVKYVSTILVAEKDSLDLTTDLSLAPTRAETKRDGDVMGRPRVPPLQDPLFVYLTRLTHNEMLFLSELVVRSLGSDVRNVRNDLPMPKISPRTVGTCPWCGTVCRKLPRCPNCRREVPEEMDSRSLLKMHARRQFTDKMVMVKNAKMHEDSKRALMAVIRSRQEALENM